jgi:hypothetical protein
MAKLNKNICSVTSLNIAALSYKKRTVAAISLDSCRGTYTIKRTPAMQSFKFSFWSVLRTVGFCNMKTSALECG